MKADNHGTHRVLAFALLAAMAGMALPATAGQGTPPVAVPAASSPPSMSKKPQRCLKRSALGKCERRAPAAAHPASAAPPPAH